MSLFDKFAGLKARHDLLTADGQDPIGLKFDAVTSSTEGVLNGKPTILLGTNNYLGLTFDPSCIEASVDAVRKEGTGTTGSRLANGGYEGHHKLEAALAQYYGRRSCMVFTTGYQANLGVLSTLVGQGDHLIIDGDSHASIYDGARMSPAQVVRFRHNDPEDLHKRLRRLKDAPGGKLVVVEGLYSMLGDTAPLKEIVAVKKEMGATLMVDEAHSMGVLGERGRGLAEAAGVEDDVDLIVGTFSKSLGSVGGFVVSDDPQFDVLRIASRPYMFTASLPPAVVASTLQALKRLQEEPVLRVRLTTNARRLYDGLAALGFQLGPEVNPIIAVAMPDVEQAMRFWRALLDAGVYLNLALPPATPENMALLRASVSAAHTAAQIDTALKLFERIGRELGVLPEAKRRAAI